MSADSSLRVVVGAGGLGRETLDAALAEGRPVTYFVDESRSGSEVRGLHVLHPSDVPPEASFVIGIADPGVRRRLARQLVLHGLSPWSVRHPRAVVGPETVLGAGTVLLANAHVSSSVVIGDHSQVQYNATIGHDTHLGDYVTVLPGANVSGSVRLEDDVTVGSGAVVLQGLVIGRGAFVGAGAVVTRDVPPGIVVVGSPARPLTRTRTRNTAEGRAD
jgi:sugar O-acyltransferase (sialic acid O-acetyltransferase NeuD family)